MMKKDVLLSICGLQIAEDMPKDAEPIEVITPAQYYFKNGKHYVLYDEIAENETEVTRNTLQFYDRYLSLTKHGADNVHMVIESEKQNDTYYATCAGMLHISLDGKNVEIKEQENKIQVDARYNLAINYEHVANCELKINIQSKESSDFSLA